MKSSTKQWKFAGVLTGFLFCCSCETLDGPQSREIDERVVTAACRSQAWLRANGYLERLEADSLDNVHLDILERMSGLPADKDGNPSVQAFLDARAGAFTDKLHGVRIKESEYRTKDGWLLKEWIADVAYRFEGGGRHFLRCVAMEVEGEWIQLIHQECIDEDFVRLSESELVCRPASPAAFDLKAAI